MNITTSDAHNDAALRRRVVGSDDTLCECDAEDDAGEVLVVAQRRHQASRFDLESIVAVVVDRPTQRSVELRRKCFAAVLRRYRYQTRCSRYEILESVVFLERGNLTIDFRV